MGTICACGPAIRQFIAYIQRTGTVMPSSSRQYPNEDFVRMRRRITLRDIFWYHRPNLTAGRVLDALPSCTQRAKEDVEATAQRSLLGDWRRKISGMIFSGNSAGNSMSSRSALPMQSSGMTVSQQESTRIGKKYKGWGLLKNESTGPSTDTQPPLLTDNSTTLNADRDYELANILADPVKTAEDDKRYSSISTERN